MKSLSPLGCFARLAVPAAAVCALASCALLQGVELFNGGSRGGLYVDPSLDLKSSPALWSVEEVKVMRGLDDERTAADAALILTLFYKKAVRRAPPGAVELKAVVRITERAIMKDFMTKYAVVVETRAFRDAPETLERRPLVMAVYAEESSSTIASAFYLYDLLAAATAAYLSP